MVQIKVVGLEAFRKRLKSLSRRKAITEAAYDRLRNAWVSGADAFIRAAIRNVLVESGMSAASFFPLSRAIARLKRSSVSTAIIEEHIRSNRKRVTAKSHATLPSGQRISGRPSEALGNRLGQRAFKLNVGSVKRPVFRFSFETSVFQHAFHEPSQKSLDLGVEAFLDTVRLRFVKDVNLLLREWLRTGQIIGAE